MVSIAMTRLVIILCVLTGFHNMEFPRSGSLTGLQLFQIPEHIRNLMNL